jgi:outer membrane lipoprotein-sorting protein
MNKLTNSSVIKFLATTVFIQLVITASIFSQETIKRYEIKKAQIKKERFTSSAGVEITTLKEIFIDNYGNNMASYETERTKIPMSNSVEEKRTVIITDGNVVTTYNPDTMEGTRMKIDQMNNYAGMSDEQAQQYAEQMGQALETEVTEAGTGEIAGVTCTIQKAVTDMMGMKTTTTTWFYKKYDMKTVSEGDVLSFNEEATEFLEGEAANFDPSLLLVKDKVNITEVNIPNY